ncbi:MAG: hypothetical protein ACYTFX_10650, partial [Planctomycetota bacterium]
INIRITYDEIEEASRSCMSDNKNYRFCCSVFPTSEHARQWRDKIVEEHDTIRSSPDWFAKGVGMSPIVVENMVVEYKGEVNDKDDPEFSKRLLEELSKINVN